MLLLPAFTKSNIRGVRWYTAMKIGGLGLWYDWRLLVLPYEQKIDSCNTASPKLNATMLFSDAISERERWSEVEMSSDHSKNWDNI